MAGTVGTYQTNTRTHTQRYTASDTQTQYNSIREGLGLAIILGWSHTLRKRERDTAAGIHVIRNVMRRWSEKVVLRNAFIKAFLILSLLISQQ
jgi:hypothetical protein